ncbi:unnamed protein product, partial [Prorocentrum cordatum]
IAVGATPLSALERPGDAAAGSAPRAPAEPPAEPPAELRGGAASAPPDVDADAAASADAPPPDAGAWQQVTCEVPKHPQLDSVGESSRHDPPQFLVKVPKPYPGIQYRGSKSLDDKLQ